MSGITRLEKVGTIFARLNAMLKRNVLPQSGKPVWYEIYALHPPYDEPRYDKVGPEDEIREILYEDDLIRAKFHEQLKRYELINLNDHSAETDTKKFINLYKTYKAQGALDDEKVFEVAFKELKSSRSQKVVEDNDFEIDDIEELSNDFGLVKSFNTINESSSTKEPDTESKKKKGSPINIKTLF
ncbi:probable 28S ribosomal protein S23, mitochondrial [Contarinia nasturtii]|uniref:probable 28S ribosomal protein S23, mitochondrial n=1 Tax=Contarinia nasturtii TaxID=265458 RepID=UPI0012D43786|nr:probable 28S ribosomal protein S23, mitochondrial [Contarinia nasturtii]